MAITAQDIQDQSFAIERKGYDVDEVDVFLEHVADEIDEMNNEITRLRAELEEAKGAEAEAKASSAGVSGANEDATNQEIGAIESGEYATIIAEKDAQIEDLKEQLAEKQANDSAISQALIIAQRSADEIIVKANAQASETMQDAREEADRILSRANADKQEVLDAIRRLEDEREDAREGYADLLRDLIEDANNKLNTLGYDDDIDNIPGVGRDIEKVEVIYEENTSAEFLPVEATETVAPSAAMTGVFEKDLSGYGDVEDDFEDVD